MLKGLNGEGKSRKERIDSLQNVLKGIRNSENQPLQEALGDAFGAYQSNVQLIREFLGSPNCTEAYGLALEVAKNYVDGLIKIAKKPDQQLPELREIAKKAQNSLKDELEKERKNTKQKKDAGQSQSGSGSSQRASPTNTGTSSNASASSSATTSPSRPASGNLAVQDPQAVLARDVESKLNESLVRAANNSRDKFKQAVEKNGRDFQDTVTSALSLKRKAIGRENENALQLAVLLANASRGIDGSKRKLQENFEAITLHIETYRPGSFAYHEFDDGQKNNADTAHYTNTPENLRKELDKNKVWSRAIDILSAKFGKVPEPSSQSNDAHNQSNDVQKNPGDYCVSPDQIDFEVLTDKDKLAIQLLGAACLGQALTNDKVSQKDAKPLNRTEFHAKASKTASKAELMLYGTLAVENAATKERPTVAENAQQNQTAQATQGDQTTNPQTGASASASTSTQQPPAATLEENLAAHVQSLNTHIEKYLNDGNPLAVQEPLNTVKAELSRILEGNNTDGLGDRENINAIFLGGILEHIEAADEGTQLSAQTLIDHSQTNRTYKQDAAIKRGWSREQLFKETMLSVIDFMEAPNKREGQKVQDFESNRMPKVGDRVRQLNLADLNSNHLEDQLGLSDNANAHVNDALLNRLVRASVAYNDVSTEPDRRLRASMREHIEKYENNSTVETWKDHSLKNFKALEEVLTKTAIAMRPKVTEKLETMVDRLESPKLGNPDQNEIQQLIKQIVVTTDAQSHAVLAKAGALKNLIEAADKLKDNSEPAAKTDLINALQTVKQTWRNTLTNPENDATTELSISHWSRADSRNITGWGRLKLNPVKTLPGVNRLPLIGRLGAALNGIARVLMAGGMAAGVFAWKASGIAGDKLGDGIGAMRKATIEEYKKVSSLP